MRQRRIALTGPPAAALYGLDGFRDLTWPDLWCTPKGARQGPRLVQTADWHAPEQLGDVPVCPLPVVLRHLNAEPDDLIELPDRISPRDRLELAVEHALRDGTPVVARFGSAPGDRLLREVLQLRGDEPPTESYAETRALQLLRSLGITPWRQIPILQNGRFAYRADFMIPFQPRRRRPQVFGPHDGMLVEIDSREHHAENFERDIQRNETYRRLGFECAAFTPNQIEHKPSFIRQSLRSRIQRAA
jgi:hypothetical protein